MSNIKINDVFQRIQYSATAGQTQFTIPFPFFANNYVYVWLNGVQLFIGAAPGQYGISGAGSPSGGLITLVTAASLNDIITIQGVMPIDRTSIYSATISNLTGSDLNGDFNREVVMMKQIETTQALLQLQYAPWAEISQDPDVTKDRYIPLLEPGQVWRMNESGTEIEGYTINSTPAPSDSAYLVYEDTPELTSSQNLGALNSGILKQTVAAGIATLAIAVPSVDYSVPSDFGTMAYQDADAVNITGGSAALTSGQVSTAPSNPTDIVNKQALDTAILNVNTFTAIAATTANFSATYNNGSSGVGATLTGTANGAASFDGKALAVNDPVLFKDQTNAYERGLYKLTTNGTAGTPPIFTRSTDYDQPSEIQPGDIVFVVDGSSNGGSSWQQTATVTNIGTDPITFSKFSQYGVLPSPFIVGSTTVTTSGTQLNLLNALTLIPINKVVSQVFTANGTYTPTPGMKYCYAHAVSGGGQGGGAVGGAAGTSGQGGGGGSGAEAWCLFDAATIGASKSVVIGAGGNGAGAGANGNAGGTTSLGALISLTGGTGGGAGTNAAAVNYTNAGSGGAISTLPAGQVGRVGEPGTPGIGLGGGAGVPGKGGASTLGGGGRGAIAGNQAGTAAANVGDAGGGAYATTVSQAGGNGGNGVIYITEYCAA